MLLCSRIEQRFKVTLLEGLTRVGAEGRVSRPVELFDELSYLLGVVYLGNLPFEDAGCSVQVGAYRVISRDSHHSVKTDAPRQHELRVTTSDQDTDERESSLLLQRVLA